MIIGTWCTDADTPYRASFLVLIQDRLQVQAKALYKIFRCGKTVRTDSLFSGDITCFINQREFGVGATNIHSDGIFFIVHILT
ncbi:hypothetical protein FQZ97_809200 [compost metagenome]